MRTFKRVIATLIMSSIASFSAAQNWPAKTVKIVVPYAAGGPADVTAREIAQKMSKLTSQSFVVENQGGAMGIPSLMAVTRAEPDGHTLWMPALGNAVLQPLLSNQGGSEHIAKLRPVGMVTTSPHVLVVSAKLPVRNVQELIAFAKANPGQVSFASAGVGGTAHLAAELFKSLTKTDVVHVPYKGSSAATNDLTSGRVSAMFSSLPSLQGLVDKGYVRLLAATAPSKSPAIRSLPLMSAAVPGFEYSSWYAMYTSRQTPTAVVTRINDLLQQTLKDSELAAKIELHGMELMPTGPDEVERWVKRDEEKWREVIQKAGISID